MKKLSAIIVAALLVATASVSAFAAGINSAEQSVLDKLDSVSAYNTGAVDNYAELKNQAENYFNTIDMTEDQANKINSIIDEAIAFYKSTGVTRLEQMTRAQKEKMVEFAQRAAAVVGVTISYDYANDLLTAKLPDGTTAGNVTTNNNNNNTNGNTNNGGSKDVIKTTGSNLNTFAVSGAAFSVILVALAGVAYSVSKKERA